MDDRLVEYEMNDNKSILVELLCLRLRCEVLLSGNNFLGTNDFRRLLVQFVPDDMLMTMRVVSKPWSLVLTAVIDDGVESGVMIVVRGGNNIDGQVAYARRDRRELVTRVIFLLNITKIGERTCLWAYNLVVVDIPEGVESIRKCAFSSCVRLTTVSFPRSLI